MSEYSKTGILFRGSSVRVCLVVLNQGCCSSGQYNLTDRMLLLDAHRALNQSYVLSLPWLTLHIRAGISIFHLSIPGIVAHVRYYISHCFYLFIFSLSRCFQLFFEWYFYFGDIDSPHRSEWKGGVFIRTQKYLANIFPSLYGHMVILTSEHFHY